MAWAGAWRGGTVGCGMWKAMTSHGVCTVHRLRSVLSKTGGRNGLAGHPEFWSSNAWFPVSPPRSPLLGPEPRGALPNRTSAGVSTGGCRSKRNGYQVPRLVVMTLCPECKKAVCGRNAAGWGNHLLLHPTPSQAAVLVHRGHRGHRAALGTSHLKSNRR